mmetsp:Transcript_61470/g.114959  ORF Transcript_61470/g.114959 Transcript_61470/m.114959 type:complete len:240 (-) Transcript_61470:2054-2773(-)
MAAAIAALRAQQAKAIPIRAFHLLLLIDNGLGTSKPTMSPKAVVEHKATEWQNEHEVDDPDGKPDLRHCVEDLRTLFPKDTEDGVQVGGQLGNLSSGILQGVHGRREQVGERSQQVDHFLPGVRDGLGDSCFLLCLLKQRKMSLRLFEQVINFGIDGQEADLGQKLVLQGSDAFSSFVQSFVNETFESVAYLVAESAGGKVADLDAQCIAQGMADLSCCGVASHGTSQYLLQRLFQSLG